VADNPGTRGGFAVNFPEGWSQGGSHDEALTQSADLLENMVASYMAEGRDLPDP
jgi:predicted RNase H-like HicB family nuclease